MAWQQKFVKCYGRLLLRVGGPSGPLVSWPDRGQGGQFTWSSDDPEGEIRDISPWAGTNASIRLYAAVLAGDAPEDPYCEMATLYAGTVCQPWRFDADEDYEIYTG